MGRYISKVDGKTRVCDGSKVYFGESIGAQVRVKQVPIEVRRLMRATTNEPVICLSNYDSGDETYISPFKIFGIDPIFRIVDS